MGYTSPKPFDISQTQRAIDYDINVIKHWLHQLNLYIGEPVNIKGKTSWNWVLALILVLVC